MAERDKVYRVNCLTNDLDALYHRAARLLGVSDSVMVVMYVLYEKGSGCPLYDIYSESGVSKQTINSALRKLEREQRIYLRQQGRTKRVYLTADGERYMQQTAQRLHRAECNAFECFSEQEFALYLELMERYNRAFEAQIREMKPLTQRTCP